MTSPLGARKCYSCLTNGGTRCDPQAGEPFSYYWTKTLHFTLENMLDVSKPYRSYRGLTFKCNFEIALSLVPEIQALEIAPATSPAFSYILLSRSHLISTGTVADYTFKVTDVLNNIQVVAGYNRFANPLTPTTASPALVTSQQHEVAFTLSWNSSSDLYLMGEKFYNSDRTFGLETVDNISILYSLAKLPHPTLRTILDSKDVLGSMTCFSVSSDLELDQQRIILQLDVNSNILSMNFKQDQPFSSKVFPQETNQVKIRCGPNTNRLSVNSSSLQDSDVFLDFAQTISSLPCIVRYHLSPETIHEDPWHLDLGAQQSTFALGLASFTVQQDAVPGNTLYSSIEMYSVNTTPSSDTAVSVKPVSTDLAEVRFVLTTFSYFPFYMDTLVKVRFPIGGFFELTPSFAELVSTGSQQFGHVTITTGRGRKFLVSDNDHPRRVIPAYVILLGTTYYVEFDLQKHYVTTQLVQRIVFSDSGNANPMITRQNAILNYDKPKYAVQFTMVMTENRDFFSISRKNAYSVTSTNTEIYPTGVQEISNMVQFFVRDSSDTIVVLHSSHGLISQKYLQPESVGTATFRSVSKDDDGTTGRVQIILSSILVLENEMNFVISSYDDDLLPFKILSQNVKIQFTSGNFPGISAECQSTFEHEHENGSRQRTKTLTIKFKSFSVTTPTYSSMLSKAQLSMKNGMETNLWKASVFVDVLFDEVAMSLESALINGRFSQYMNGSLFSTKTFESTFLFPVQPSGVMDGSVVNRILPDLPTIGSKSPFIFQVQPIGDFLGSQLYKLSSENMIFTIDASQECSAFVLAEATEHYARDLIQGSNGTSSFAKLSVSVNLIANDLVLELVGGQNTSAFDASDGMTIVCGEIEIEEEFPSYELHIMDISSVIEYSLHGKITLDTFYSPSLFERDFEITLFDKGKSKYLRSWPGFTSVTSEILMRSINFPNGPVVANHIRYPYFGNIKTVSINLNGNISFLKYLGVAQQLFQIRVLEDDGTIENTYTFPSHAISFAGPTITFDFDFIPLSKKNQITFVLSTLNIDVPIMTILPIWSIQFVLQTHTKVETEFIAHFATSWAVTPSARYPEGDLHSEIKMVSNVMNSNPAVLGTIAKFLYHIPVPRGDFPPDTAAQAFTIMLTIPTGAVMSDSVFS